MGSKRIGGVLSNVGSRWRIGVQLTGDNETLSSLSTSEVFKFTLIGAQSKSESESLDTDSPLTSIGASVNSGG